MDINIKNNQIHEEGMILINKGKIKIEHAKALKNRQEVFEAQYKELCREYEALEEQPN